uniref:E3 ubiquitin-protein ligase Jade-2 n=1 Tax=Sphaerodactylus townsendi TaxID=933632 RepID=A0ACB8EJQ0_9SAUR
MPSCITAFHVTCAFERNLDMRTLLAENDEVKFKSFCLEHSSNAIKPPDQVRTEADQGRLDMEKVTLRKQKLQQLEEDFYDLVKPSEVAENLDMAEWLVDFVYQYWKMKRKANYNKPLMMPKTDEVDNLAQQEQDVLYRRLKLFTHLRQDLERSQIFSQVQWVNKLQLTDLKQEISREGFTSSSLAYQPQSSGANHDRPYLAPEL